MRFQNHKSECQIKIIYESNEISARKNDSLLLLIHKCKSIECFDYVCESTT